MRNQTLEGKLTNQFALYTPLHQFHSTHCALWREFCVRYRFDLSAWKFHHFGWPHRKVKHFYVLNCKVKANNPKRTCQKDFCRFVSIWQCEHASHTAEEAVSSWFTFVFYTDSKIFSESVVDTQLYFEKTSNDWPTYTESKIWAWGADRYRLDSECPEPR